MAGDTDIEQQLEAINTELFKISGAHWVYAAPVGCDGADRRPSIVWRGDSVVLPALVPRWAQRMWLTQNVGPITSPQDQKIGFVNLRPTESLPPEWEAQVPHTADAYLAPPERMLRPNGNYEIPLASNFGQHYGEDDGLRVTCFCKPHQTMGGMCAQSAVLMSAAMMTHHGFRVPMMHEVSYWATQRRERYYDRSKPSEAAKMIAADGAFAVGGMDFNEIKSVFRDGVLIGGGAIVERNPTAGFPLDDQKMIKRFYQYLTQGLPVILVVDHGFLSDREVVQRDRDAPGEYTPAFESHAIVLVGVVRGPADRRGQRPISGFVYHDPNAGPYRELKVERLLMAARFPYLDPADSRLNFGFNWSYPA